MCRLICKQKVVIVLQFSRLLFSSRLTCPSFFDKYRPAVAQYVKKVVY